MVYNNSLFEYDCAVFLNVEVICPVRNVADLKMTVCSIDVPLADKSLIAVKRNGYV